MLAMPQIDLVSTLVNFIARYCYVVRWLAFFFRVKGALNFRSFSKLFACKEASLDQARVLKIVVAKNSCS